MSDIGQQDPLDESLRAVMRMLRQEHGLRIDQLAERMGVDYKTVWRIEKGMRRLHLPLFVRWCAALGEPPSKVLRFSTTQCPKQENAEQIPLIPDNSVQ